MPLNAMATAHCDYVLKLSDISELLVKLAAEPVEKQGVDMNEQEFDEASNLEKSPQSHKPSHGEYAYEKGKPSIYSCPDCGGVLAEIDEDGLLRFVCRVGHAYSPEWMAALQSENVEKALWTALRSLEEGASFAQHMATRPNRRAEGYAEKAKDYEKQAEVLRRLLLN
jgi:two-component system chemotaxis response regulator CheB